MASTRDGVVCVCVCGIGRNKDKEKGLVPTEEVESRDTCLALRRWAAQRKRLQGQRRTGRSLGMVS